SAAPSGLRTDFSVRVRRQHHLIMTRSGDNLGSSQPVEKDFFASFERLVSAPRLKRYRRATASKREAVALYLWNMALCEALYPSLQLFEVSLRNATHSALTLIHGNPRWFMDMAVVTQGRHQSQVFDAIQALRKHAKSHFVGIETDVDFPKEPNRVIAELSLAFWVNLYSDPYTTAIVTRIGRLVFPNAPTDARQHVIYARLNRILVLRNRVFHHEPVYHWTLSKDESSLLRYHDTIIEIMGWMSTSQPIALSAIDRFRAVHDNRHHAFLDCVDLAFLEAEERIARGEHA
ncbi:MAG: Abi family protein, partial [Capsulimonadaceae bacterium]